MTPHGPTLDWFDPTILAPHFSTAVTNCLTERDTDYLRAQLTRHLFAVIDLPGGDMHDRHGLALTLRKIFGLPADLAVRLDELPALLHDAIATGSARRAALLLHRTDVLIGSDFALFLLFLQSIERTAGLLRQRTEPIQLLLFLADESRGFPSVAPSARRRAEAHAGLKVMPAAEVFVQPWSQPRPFNIGPQHQLTFAPAAWYYLSRGHRRRGPEDVWECFEESDVLTFVRADGGFPCLEGVFARTRAGMQLVGIRYESDPQRFSLPAFSENPFTLFRGLCDQLAAWQAAP